MSTKRPAPGNGATADGIFDEIHEVMFLFRAKLIEAGKADGHGVGGMELRVLRFFEHRPGATQAELGQHSGRDKGQIARLVRLLMERGLLQREVAGKRNSGLKLTEQGRLLQRRMHRHRATLADKYAAALGAAERSQLIALLQRVKAALGSVQSPDPP
jgi:DNA-binding MarR family transcriptional regulator